MTESITIIINVAARKTQQIEVDKIIVVNLNLKEVSTLYSFNLRSDSFIVSCLILD